MSVSPVGCSSRLAQGWTYLSWRLKTPSSALPRWRQRCSPRPSMPSWDGTGSPTNWWASATGSRDDYSQLRRHRRCLGGSRVCPVHRTFASFSRLILGQMAAHRVWRWSRAARLPAIRQQRCLASPRHASCRLDSIRVLSCADVRERMGKEWGGNGWLVNGMQEVRSLPPGFTRYSSMAGGQVGDHAGHGHHRQVAALPAPAAVEGRTRRGDQVGGRRRRSLVLGRPPRRTADGYWSSAATRSSSATASLPVTAASASCLNALA